MCLNFSERATELALVATQQRMQLYSIDIAIVMCALRIVVCSIVFDESLCSSCNINEADI